MNPTPTVTPEDIVKGAASVARSLNAATFVWPLIRVGCADGAAATRGAAASSGAVTGTLATAGGAEFPPGTLSTVPGLTLRASVMPLTCCRSPILTLCWRDSA